MLKGTVVAFVLVVIFNSVGLVHAQPDERWYLDFKSDNPKIYVQKDHLGNKSYYWYVVSEITNVTKKQAPLLIDILMYTPLGRENLTDIQKLDPSMPDTGRFYSSISHPEIEYEIIKKLVKIPAVDEEIVKERIKDLKKMGKYLNLGELRERKFIQPAETLQCLVLFKDVDLRSKKIEVLVSGLWDIVYVSKVTPKGRELSYENRILRMLYDFPGDEFDREYDKIYFSKKEWTVKNLGPVTSKDTLEQMVNMLVDVLRKEKARKEGKPSNVGPELRVADYLLKSQTGQDFGFDPSNNKTILDNEDAIWKWHEWWLKNKAKLYYDEKQQKFVVEEK